MHWATVLTQVVVAPARWAMLRRTAGRVGEFRVAVARERGDPGPYVGRLAEAVALLERTWPGQLGRVAAVTPDVLVCDLPLGGAGYYWTWPRAIVFDAGTLLEQYPVWAAAALVHEGTHARLRRAGIRTTSRNRDRVEARCVREEIEFLERVLAPDAEEAGRLIAWSREALTNPARWYEPAERIRRLREVARKEGVPSGIADWVLRADEGAKDN
jgi:hypothetical protein